MSCGPCPFELFFRDSSRRARLLRQRKVRAPTKGTRASSTRVLGGTLIRTIGRRAAANGRAGRRRPADYDYRTAGGG